MLVSANSSYYLLDIFKACLKVLKIKFNIVGIEATLLQFLFFDILLFIVLYVVFRLFNK